MAKLEKSESAIIAKQNAAEKRREKARRIDSLFKGGNEPTINPFDYRITLIQALNWYNLNVDFKQLRTYLNQYLIDTERKKLITTFNQLSDFDIRSLATICRLKTRGQYLEPREESFIENTISKLLESISQIVKPDKPVKQVESKIDKTNDQLNAHLDDIEGVIDEFVKTKKTNFNPAEYLKAKEITGTVAKKIAEYYSSLLNELKYVNDDKELSEGYSNFSKTQLKKFIALVESIISSCNQQVVSVKIRKPRKIKPVNPVKLVSKLQYANEYKELKLKSIKPEKIIGCSELWVYNTKYRKLAVYRAEDSSKLSVKGTTILGYDIKKSSQVMLRKPDDFFSKTPIAKKALAAGLQSVNTRPVVPNGRINSDTILLGVF